MRALLRPRRLAVAGVLLVLGVGVGAAQADAFTTSDPLTGSDDAHGLILGSRQRPAPEHGAVPDRRHQGRRRLLDEGVRGRRAGGAAGRPTSGSRPARPPRAPAATSATPPPPTAPATTRSTSRRSSRPTSTTARSTACSRAARRASAARTATSPSPTSSPTSTATRSRPSSASSTAACRPSTSSSRPTATPAPGPTVAYKENRLEEGDVQEALDAALAVGDFDAANPGHHGTPEQREQAWNTGFESGDPSACNTYVEGDGGSTEQSPGRSRRRRSSPRSTRRSSSRRSTRRSRRPKYPQAAVARVPAGRRATASRRAVSYRSAGRPSACSARRGP